jgi:Na+/melibiose symporter-like transporter
MLRSTEDAISAPAQGEEADPANAGSNCPGWLVNLGWLNTTLALSLHGLPLQYVLKDQLHLNEEALARFLLIANLPIYFKPFAGILSDALPLFGTRRRHYVVLGFLASSLLWLLMGLVPRTFGSLVFTYGLLNVFLTLVSTVLGGLMVEVGQRENRTGQLGAQRQGITQFSAMVGSQLAGVLARLPYFLTTAAAATFYAISAPVFWRWLREPGKQKPAAGPLREVARQARVIMRSRTLWAAAGMVMLIVAAPGFGTPLFFYQTNVLKFPSELVGTLGMIGGAGAVAAAAVYIRVCRRFSLRVLLPASILLHAGFTLLYLAYRSPVSAVIIAAIEGATLSLTLIPLYDLATRATPKGSEALGYCVVQSVWNLTTMLSNYSGSWLSSEWHLTFQQLVWLNAGTTLAAIVAVPFLPRVLLDRKEGET